MAESIDKGLNQEMDSRLIVECAVFKAKKYLEEQILESMKEDIEKIALEAVSHWAEVRLNKSAGFEPFGDTKIHVNFIENVVKTIAVANKISITHSSEKT